MPKPIQTPLPRARSAKWLAFVRAETHGRVWLVCTLICGLLFLQITLGWPLRRKLPLPAFAAGTVVEYRLPAACPGDPWQSGSLRVTCAGSPVRVYSNLNFLEEGAGEGYEMRGKQLALLRRENAGEQVPRWTVEFPWTLKRWQIFTIASGMAGWSALLGAFGNPFLLKSGRRLNLWLAQPRRPWVLLAAAAATVALAVALRVYGFSFPEWANDTPSHYRSVFRVALGLQPSVTPDRPFGLSLVMGWLLRALPDLRAVVAVQGVATVVAAMAIGSVIWWSGARLFEEPFLQALCRVTGVLVLALLACCEFLLSRERELLAESWVAFYLGTQILLAWYLTARDRPLPQQLAAFGLFCSAGLLAFFTRPNWGLALAALPLPWLACGLAGRVQGRSIAWLTAGAVMLLLPAALTFGYQRLCTPEAGMAALYERSRALLCWHIPLVRPEIERRLMAQPPDSQRPLLAEVANAMDEELARARRFGPGSYPSIGYDADHLYFDTLPECPQLLRLPLAERSAFCSRLFRDALWHHPGIYFAKVLRQMPRLFASPYHKSTLSPGEVQNGFAKSRAATEGIVFPPGLAPKYAQTLDRAEGEFATSWPSPARLMWSRRESVIFLGLNDSFGWTMAVSLTICAAAALHPRWRRALPWRKYTPVLAVGLWSLSSVILSALTSALVQGLDVQRYLDLFMPLVLLCHVLWPLLTLSVLWTLAKARLLPKLARSPLFNRKPDYQTPLTYGG